MQSGKPHLHWIFLIFLYKESSEYVACRFTLAKSRKRSSVASELLCQRMVVLAVEQALCESLQLRTPSLKNLALLGERATKG
jgi:hypothetical protein